MSKYFLVPILLGSLIVAPWGQTPAPLKGTDLKGLIEGMGYETKSIGTDPEKPVYEFKVTKSELDIPIAAEVSGTGRYVWLTVFLGAAPGDASEKNAGLLKRNGAIQPTQFFVTSKGNLKMGLAIENRGVTPAGLKWAIEKLTTDVVESKSAWGG